MESIFSDQSRSRNRLKFVDSAAMMTGAGRGQDKLEDMVEDKIKGREGGLEESQHMGGWISRGLAKGMPGIKTWRRATRRATDTWSEGMKGVVKGAQR